jgi:hypothetical protein
MNCGGVPGPPVDDEQGRASVMIVIVVGCTDHLPTPLEAVELRESEGRADYWDREHLVGGRAC